MERWAKWHFVGICVVLYIFGSLNELRSGVGKKERVAGKYLKLRSREGSHAGDATILWIGNGEFNVPYGQHTTIEMMKKRVSRVADVPINRLNIFGFKELDDQILPEDDDYVAEFINSEKEIYMEGTCRREIAEFELQRLLARQNATNSKPDLNETAIFDTCFQDLLKKEPYKSQFEFRKTRVSFTWVTRPRKNRRLLVLDLDHTIVDVSPSCNFTCVVEPKNKTKTDDKSSDSYLDSEDLEAMAPEELKRKLEGSLEASVDHGDPGFDVRPHVHEFLKAIYPRYDIIIWSGADLGWVYNVSLDADLLDNPNYKITAILDYRSMMTVNSKYGKITTKPLQYIWDNSEGLYDESNTILVDDLRRNAVLNPRSLIWVKPYAQYTKDDDQEFLVLKEYLLALSSLSSFTGFNHSRYMEIRESSQSRESLQRHREREKAVEEEEKEKQNELQKERLKIAQERERVYLKNESSAEFDSDTENTEDRIKRKTAEYSQAYDPIVEGHKLKERAKKLQIKISENARFGKYGKESNGLPPMMGELFWEDGPAADRLELENRKKLRDLDKAKSKPKSQPGLFALAKPKSSPGLFALGQTRRRKIQPSETDSDIDAKPPIALDEAEITFQNDAAISGPLVVGESVSEESLNEEDAERTARARRKGIENFMRSREFRDASKRAREMSTKDDVDSRQQTKRKFAQPPGLEVLGGLGEEEIYNITGKQKKRDRSKFDSIYARISEGYQVPLETILDQEVIPKAAEGSLNHNAKERVEKAQNIASRYE